MINWLSSRRNDEPTINKTMIIIEDYIYRTYIEDQDILIVLLKRLVY